MQKKASCGNMTCKGHLAGIQIDEIESDVLVLIGCDVPEAHLALDQTLEGRKSPCAMSTTRNGGIRSVRLRSPQDWIDQ